MVTVFTGALVVQPVIGSHVLVLSHAATFTHCATSLLLVLAVAAIHTRCRLLGVLVDCRVLELAVDARVAVCLRVVLLVMARIAGDARRGIADVVGELRVLVLPLDARLAAIHGAMSILVLAIMTGAARLRLYRACRHGRKAVLALLAVEACFLPRAGLIQRRLAGIAGVIPVTLALLGKACTTRGARALVGRAAAQELLATIARVARLA